jgi:uncharacterized protein YjbI with pentapeptide repeats
METAQILNLNHVKQRIEATQCNFADSTFHDVNLANATFDDVNLSKSQFSNVNLSNIQVRNANMSGVKIQDADLRGASIAHCLTDGMTIGGISVADLLAAYRAANIGNS